MKLVTLHLVYFLFKWGLIRGWGRQAQGEWAGSCHTITWSNLVSHGDTGGHLHLCCFQCLTIMNIAVMNHNTYIFIFSRHSSLGKINSQYLSLKSQIRKIINHSPFLLNLPWLRLYWIQTKYWCMCFFLWTERKVENKKLCRSIFRKEAYAFSANQFLDRNTSA